MAYLAPWRTDLTVERKLGDVNGAGAAVDAVRNPDHIAVSVDKHVNVAFGDLRVRAANNKTLP